MSSATSSHIYIFKDSLLNYINENVEEPGAKSLSELVALIFAKLQEDRVLEENKFPYTIMAPPSLFQPELMRSIPQILNYINHEWLTPFSIQSFKYNSAEVTISLSRPNMQNGCERLRRCKLTRSRSETGLLEVFIKIAANYYIPEINANL